MRGARSRDLLPEPFPGIGAQAALERRIRRRGDPGIGMGYLQEGRRTAATASLRQALAIYQQIGTPDSLRIQEALHRYEH